MAGATPSLGADFPAAAAVGERLRERGWNVAVAESCTGGLLGAALTTVPGSSAYFRGGVIAYANDVKERELDVPAAVLETHGAVSSETARLMAEGVRRRLRANVGLSVTGIAGPADADSAKPAGLIFVGIATATGGRIIRLEEDGDREANRAAAVRAALDLLLAEL